MDYLLPGCHLPACTTSSFCSCAIQPDCGLGLKQQSGQRWFHHHLCHLLEGTPPPAPGVHCVLFSLPTGMEEEVHCTATSSQEDAHFTQCLPSPSTHHSCLTGTHSACTWEDLYLPEDHMHYLPPPVLTWEEFLHLEEGHSLTWEERDWATWSWKGLLLLLWMPVEALPTTHATATTATFALPAIYHPAVCRLCLQRDLHCHYLPPLTGTLFLWEALSAIATTMPFSLLEGSYCATVPDTASWISLYKMYLIHTMPLL